MQERLNAIKARAEAATPGPWGQCVAATCPMGNAYLYLDSEDYVRLAHDNDMQFIAHSRQDIPWLIEQVERLQAEVQRKQVALTQIQDLLIGTDFRSRERIESILQRARDEHGPA